MMFAITMLLATFITLTLSAGIPDACQSTQEPGSRRECIGMIIAVNSSADCKALCCADSAANPIPLPGIPPAGCVAWYASIRSEKGSSQGECFLCEGMRRGKVQPVPPVNTSCTSSTTSVCTTGVVAPTVGPSPPKPPTIIPSIGTEGSAQFVDVIKQGIRPPSYVNGTNAPLNRTTELSVEGWPLMDCQITVFDARPTHAWAPPMDDPEHRQDDYSGEWTLTLVGNATVSLVNAFGITLGTPTYDEDSNTLTQPIVFAKGAYPKVQNLLVLSFTNTRASASSPQALNGTGFRDLRVYRPGYGPSSGKSTQVFTDSWASLLSIFSRVRWMGAAGTNSYNWRCAPPNAAACSVVQWNERNTPNLAFFDEPNLPTNPISWEYVLLAANELDSDVWINVPLTASSPSVCRSDPLGDHTKCIKEDPTTTYEYQLAVLFRDGNNFTGNVGLKPHLKIYVEHGNEVWNFGFKTHSMNEAFAEWEVLNTSSSNLDKPVPGHPDIEQRQQCTNRSSVSKPGGNPSPVGASCWGRRRHARRVYEIAQTFETVFGKGSLNSRVRMVYASWGLEGNIQTYFNDTLLWLEAEKGDVSQFLYAISYAQYSGPTSQNVVGKATFNYSTATIPEVIEAFEDSNLQSVTMTIEFVKFAKTLGVKSVSYEGGPGYQVGGEHPGSKGLDTMIEASRDQGMTQVVKNHIDYCWQFGWDEYNYFAAEGKVSGYGCWGSTETFADLNPGPPKLQALYEVTGKHPHAQAKWAANATRPRARRFNAAATIAV
eukprot:m.161388 g.161388  ORF g.161388 m.161388 type:complete len:769 (+) comp31231_c0_seq3:377-2683(+)